MESYSKHAKKYYFSKKFKKQNLKLQKNFLVNDKKKRTYFDRLYTRIFLSSLLLLFLIGGKVLGRLNLNLLQENINVIPLLDLFIKPLNILPNDIPTSNKTIYEYISFQNGNNIIRNSSFNGVSCAANGIVVKISKKDTLYEVTIKAENDLEYIYKDLINIDVTLYNYVTLNTIIGEASHVNEYYQYVIVITDQVNNYNLLKLNE